MYTVAVRRDFIARHKLVGADRGPENRPHAHHYVVEARLYGNRLDRNGYLLDICTIEGRMDELVAHFRDATLGELPEFEGLNPSLEHFARIFHRSLRQSINRESLTAMAVKLWENDLAWAEYREDF